MKTVLKLNANPLKLHEKILFLGVAALLLVALFALVFG